MQSQKRRERRAKIGEQKRRSAGSEFAEGYIGRCEVWAVEEVSFEAVLEGAGRATPAMDEPKPNC